MSLGVPRVFAKPDLKIGSSSRGLAPLAAYQLPGELSFAGMGGCVLHRTRRAIDQGTEIL